MRVLNLSLALLMLGFAGVQYNDPDGIVWMVYYGLAGLAAALAAWRPHLWRHACVRVMHLLSIVVALGLAWWLRPLVDGWWRQAVWWEIEAVREGMGMMIVSAVLAIALIGARRANHAMTGKPSR